MSDNYDKDKKVKRHLYICECLNEIYKAKNEDYGDSFSKTYERLGDISVLTRILDKVDRLENLVVNKADINYESLEDNLLDLANYCVMWLVELDYDDDVRDFEDLS